MNSSLKTAVVGVLLLGALGGCTNTYDPGQRAAGGALIGAGSGAAIGAAASGRAAHSWARQSAAWPARLPTMPPRLRRRSNGLIIQINLDGKTS